MDLYSCTFFLGSDNVEYQFVMNNETTEYLAKELLPHTAYVFFVMAYSHGGSSGPSENVTVEMLEDGEWLDLYTNKPKENKKLYRN